VAANDVTMRLIVEVTIMAAPFLLWLALYATAHWRSVNLHPALRWVRALRWVTYATAVVLFCFHLAHESFPSSHGMALLIASLGLSGVEQWMKRRFTASC
jgi:hypothetical protein